MVDDENVTIYTPEETRLENHPLTSKRSGRTRYEMVLHDDPKTGMIVKYVRYMAGHPVVVHKHECGKGMFVLRGILHTEHGDFGPGSWIWWKPGSVMFHGATQDEDVDVIFVTNQPFDIEYLGREIAPNEEFDSNNLLG